MMSENYDHHLVEKLTQAKERIAELKAAIEAAHGVMLDTEEINPSNYDHDLVCQLNTSFSEAFGILDAALNGGRGDEMC
jgi:hypothetical protein